MEGKLIENLGNSTKYLRAHRILEHSPQGQGSRMMITLKLIQKSKKLQPKELGAKESYQNNNNDHIAVTLNPKFNSFHHLALIVRC
jgi:hypothetical protein